MVIDWISWKEGFLMVKKQPDHSNSLDLTLDDERTNCRAR